jgi:integrase
MNLDRVDARSRLKPRRDPYWQRLAQGRYVGFRKMTKGAAGTWLARIYLDGKYQQHPLGDFGDLDEKDRYDEAKKKAEVWFTHMGAGGAAKPGTVGEACEAYVEHLKTEKSAKAAQDADGRFRRLVYGDPQVKPIVKPDPIASISLTKLATSDVGAWRKRVLANGSDAGFNRNATALRAALNLALEDGKVATDLAWRTKLKPIRNADGRRETCLDIAQRRKFVEKAPADLAAFLRGLSLLPLRPGALAALTVGDYDNRLKMLRIGEDKAGADRKIRLPDTTAAFLEMAAKGKLPAAPLLARADGKAWDKDAWKKPVKAAAKAAELPSGTTAYTLRHSVITDLVHDGVDLLTVAQISGTSVVMIERHYGHLRDSVASSALARLSL